MKRPFTPWRAALAALVSGLALCWPLAHAQAPASPATAQQFTLANGMALIVKPDRRAPTATHMVWVRVGAMDEVDGTSGVAHVLEHMMFKGTDTLKPGEFSRRVAALGGRENAFTSRDATAYHQQVPAERLEDAMRLEADRFANNRWSDDEFQRELQVVKEERRQRTEDSPRARMFEAFNAAIYQASPYRRPIIGWMSDLDAMTPQDAREFFRRWYVPANAALVITGDVDLAQVREMAERHFGRLPTRAVPERKPRVEPPQQGPRRIEYRAVADQALVALAYRAPQWRGGDTPEERDALALTMLAAVLDGYNGARLDRALVQGQGSGGQRVADSASAGYGLMGRGPQVFTLSAVPARGVSADAAAAALKAEVERIAREGVQEAELQRVKTQWTASEVYKLDSVFAQAQELGSYWVTGLPIDTGERLLKALQQVTPAQVQDVARRYFADTQLTTAVLVPERRDNAAAR